MTDENTAENNTKAKVLIVDDHPIVREGLTALINAQPDMLTCGEASDGPEALKAISALHPDVAIIDIVLKGMNGIELSKRIQNGQEPCFVLILSMHEESIYAERALRAGARGYIMKGEPRGKLLEAIRKILANEIWVSERMTNQMLARIATGDETGLSPSVNQLSDRELTVFTMIGHGSRPQEIAEELGISVRTVDAHRDHIKNKLNLNNTRALIKYAVEWVNDQSGSQQSS